MVRFLHAADLHLGVRMTRFSESAAGPIREARYRAIENLRAEASRSDAKYDFVLIAGDLFDDAHVSRSVANRAFNLLEDFPIPVLVIPGNHDPFLAGSVWELPPWNREDAARVRLFTRREPVEFRNGVKLFPCPVYRKRSAENPTQWIADHPMQAFDGIRIGIAHGSVMDRPDLPPDDHPISHHAPEELSLDYLALGHWHQQKTYRMPDGGQRMAYSGVHEPMRFSDDDGASGWREYAAGGSRSEFLDDGRGLALSVTIERPGAAPAIEPVSIQHLRWSVRREQIQSEGEFNKLLKSVAEADQPERTLLRLCVSGSLPLEAMGRLEELREVVDRYVVGELDERQLLVEPTEDEVREVVGGGVLKTVWSKLQAMQNPEEFEGQSDETPDPATIERALRLFYRISAESKSAAT